MPASLCRLFGGKWCSEVARRGHCLGSNMESDYWSALQMAVPDGVSDEAAAMFVVSFLQFPLAADLGTSGRFVACFSLPVAHVAASLCVLFICPSWKVCFCLRCQVTSGRLIPRLGYLSKLFAALTVLLTLSPLSSLFLPTVGPRLSNALTSPAAIQRTSN